LNRLQRFHLREGFDWLTSSMVFVRRMIAAILAVSVVWAGIASAQPGHAHDLDDGIGAALHMLSTEAHAEHHAAIDMHGHDHRDLHHSHDDSVQQPGQLPDHERGAVFHVHATCLVALEPECVTVARATVVQAVHLPELVVPLHTRSVMPADRPPRPFL
jgi:hypothetical protein